MLANNKQKPDTGTVHVQLQHLYSILSTTVIPEVEDVARVFPRFVAKDLRLATKWMLVNNIQKPDTGTVHVRLLNN
jgi:hypothetical protein